MRKILIITSILFGFISNIYSQNDVSDNGHKELKNSIYLELGGSCGTISLNYERAIIKNGKHLFYFRTGIAPYSTQRTEHFQIPLSFNYVYGERKLKFETGITIVNKINFTPSEPWEYEDDYIVAATTPSPFWKPVLSPTIGIRYLTKSNILFKIHFSPLIEKSYYSYEICTFQPWGGLSIGLSF